MRVIPMHLDKEPKEPKKEVTGVRKGLSDFTACVILALFAVLCVVGLVLALKALVWALYL